MLKMPPPDSSKVNGGPESISNITPVVSYTNQLSVSPTPPFTWKSMVSIMPSPTTMLIVSGLLIINPDSTSSLFTVMIFDKSKNPLSSLMLLRNSRFSKPSSYAM